MIFQWCKIIRFHHTFTPAHLIVVVQVQTLHRPTIYAPDHHCLKSLHERRRNLNFKLRKIFRLRDNAQEQKLKYRVCKIQRFSVYFSFVIMLAKFLKFQISCYCKVEFKNFTSEDLPSSSPRLQFCSYITKLYFNKNSRFSTQLGTLQSVKST